MASVVSKVFFLCRRTQSSLEIQPNKMDAIRQDLPPEGGYRPINFKRIPAQQLMRGMFALFSLILTRLAVKIPIRIDGDPVSMNLTNWNQLILNRENSICWIYLSEWSGYVLLLRSSQTEDHPFGSGEEQRPIGVPAAVVCRKGPSVSLPVVCSITQKECSSPLFYLSGICCK